ncbi:MAG TPA: biotin/lipoyl-containing protein [Salinimicrobium sp.]|nr:biotin/lipoyl-containing protein [Salinimicrobium sp.]
MLFQPTSMEKYYKVKTNDSSEFSISQTEIDKLDMLEISPSHFHALKEQHSFSGEIVKSDFLNRSYSVKINSNIYNVKISNELDLMIEEMGLALSTATLINEIKAPMPGLILEINVNEGDEVKEGDYLLVLEAMKMENTIIAPRDGIVKKVFVKAGETVDKNQLLIEME